MGAVREELQETIRECVLTHGDSTKHLVRKIWLSRSGSVTAKNETTLFSVIQEASIPTTLGVCPQRHLCFRLAKNPGQPRAQCVGRGCDGMDQKVFWSTDQLSCAAIVRPEECYC